MCSTRNAQVSPQTTRSIPWSCRTVAPAAPPWLWDRRCEISLTLTSLVPYINQSESYYTTTYQVNIVRGGLARPRAEGELLPRVLVGGPVPDRRAEPSAREQPHGLVQRKVLRRAAAAAGRR